MLLSASIFPITPPRQVVSWCNCKFSVLIPEHVGGLLTSKSPPSTTPPLGPPQYFNPKLTFDENGSQWEEGPTTT